MPRARNPFKPSAGSDPPLLVGRSGLVDEFSESIEDGPGAPGRTTIFTGPRGVGKTVMLNAIGERVQAHYQWRVIHETATPGLLDRLTARSLHLTTAAHSSGRAITGLSVAGVEALSLAAPVAPAEMGLREALGALLDELESNDTGLLITVDEVHAGKLRDELPQFAAIVQHLVREDREIAVAMAGLPSGVSELLNDQVTTFLRRAERHVLGEVDLADVRAALEQTVTAHDRTITDPALDAATRATNGYPFMIQLVGYHLWRQASDSAIGLDDVKAGISAARQRLESLVHSTAMADLSQIDRRFLALMAQDNGTTSVEAIRVRLGKSARYVSVYRRRLIDAGMIAPAGRGRVAFALPFLREYLRERAEQYLADEDPGPESA
ncbi:MAG: AAA family ATPase [Bifidobacteriaceae bacterium]|jgi:hypothetical protein|nr:AAA family ATPase [Bifidobacteriaceae bacterium]